MSKLLNLPLSEYPRPQFERDSYLCLNGLWDYAIKKSDVFLDKFDGKILVPYSPESNLSGVKKQVGPDDFLHYHTVFNLEDGFNKGRVFLNFGACDQVCKVYLNGVFVGMHEGGYNSFSFEITNYLVDYDNNLYIIVTDDANSDIYGRGKQKYKRGGIWYTATSGIWQTVWLESTPKNYIKSITFTPDIDNNLLHVCCDKVGDGPVNLNILDDGETVKTCSFDNKISIDVTNFKLWSPENPNLYRVEVTFNDDIVRSYFGLRKFSIINLNGKKYFALNNKPYFNNGLLDQGYWVDGLYTPPSNKAMFDEIKSVKDLGFNMLRKHIKVEPMLWYYYCDLLGVLVWQDMINGGKQYPAWRIMLAPFINLKLDDTNSKKMGRTNESYKQFLIESRQMHAQLYNTASICLFTPYNECWGQYKAQEVYELFKLLDPSRLYDHASGWVDVGAGDLTSRHIYFRKAKMKNDGIRILALTEFGGYSYSLKGHVFTSKKFGYKSFSNKDALQKAYKKLFVNEIIPLILNEGLCATVYTQLSDVEDEVNGLFTYDRILKFDKDFLVEVNRLVYKTFEDSIKK